MTPVAVSEGCIPYEVLQLFRRMRSAVEEVPDMPATLLTCHAVCQALAAKFGGVEVVEGKFAGSEHSWLTPTGYPAIVMDMYPWAGASSFIVFTDCLLLPWQQLYVPCEIDFDRPDVMHQVTFLLKHM